MKKLYSILIAALLTASVFLPQQASAQAPEKMSYQAVVRDGSNALVTSTAVGMRISILQTTPSGTAVYVETQTPTSNANGLVSLEIGSGTVVSGGFTTIDWSAGPYFIKTETDPDGGTNYTITGTSQLLSVPYALYAGNGLSAADKTKLDNLNDGAELNVQSDWGQTDIMADDFIKNKPTIPSDVNQLADMDNLLGSSSFSGSFNDLTDVPTNLDTDATDDFSGSYDDLSDQPDLSVFLTSETDPTVAANFDFSGAAMGDLLQFNGSKWVKAAPTYPVSTAVNSTTFLSTTARLTWVDDPQISLIVPETGKYLLSFYGSSFNSAGETIANGSPDYDSEGLVRVFNNSTGTQLISTSSLRFFFDDQGPAFSKRKLMPMQPSRTIMVNLNQGDELKIQYNQTSFGTMTTPWFIGSGGISLLKIGN